jgi:hypothetical protein
MEDKVKLPLCLTKYHVVKAYILCLIKNTMKYGRLEVYLHAFLISALDGGEW